MRRRHRRGQTFLPVPTSKRKDGLGPCSPYLCPKDIQRALQDELHAGLDPNTKPGPVRSLRDMTPQEVAALETRYGCKVVAR
jgi:hypothetical protein